MLIDCHVCGPVSVMRMLTSARHRPALTSFIDTFHPSTRGSPFVSIDKQDAIVMTIFIADRIITSRDAISVAMCSARQPW
jgi:hypothetical protein